MDCGDDGGWSKNPVVFVAGLSRRRRFPNLTLESELAQAAVGEGLPSCCGAGKVFTHPWGF